MPDVEDERHLRKGNGLKDVFNMITYQNNHSGNLSRIVSLLTKPKVDTLIRRSMLSVGQISNTSSSWKFRGRRSSLIRDSAPATGHGCLVVCAFVWRLTIMWQRRDSAQVPGVVVSYVLGSLLRFARGWINRKSLNNRQTPYTYFLKLTCLKRALPESPLLGT